MRNGTDEKIDDAFASFIAQRKAQNIVPLSVGAVEMSLASGVSVNDITKRMTERVEHGEIKSYKSINGIRYSML